MSPPAVHSNQNDLANSIIAPPWSFPGKVEDMLKAVEGRDKKLKAVVRRIPPDVLIDWKLFWRDPAQQWV
jgi:hypothetical protein